MKMRDSEGLDRTLAAQRAGGGAWLTGHQIDQLYAPTAAAVATVSAFLKARGLSVSGVGPENLFIKATGTAAAVDAAFRVQLHRYTLGATTFHASVVAPTLPAAIAPLVASVGGLSDVPMQPAIATRKIGQFRPNIKNVNDIRDKPWTLLPLKSVGLGGGAAAATTLTSQCLYQPTTVEFSGGGVTASYTGAVLGSTASTGLTGITPPCVYLPADIYTAYNLTPLYKAGLDGTGETVAIVDAYGSTTIQQDLAAFSSVAGLPAANLQIIGTLTGSILSSDATIRGWAAETTLDVEWVHAIAAGAKIILVVAPTQSDLTAAVLTAEQQPGVVAISNSWATFESGTEGAGRTATDTILKLAAAKGIAVNFASGDYGNYNGILGYADVSYPASSPYATSIGGVSVVLDSGKHILFQSAWGNNIAVIATPGADGSSQPLDPPVPIVVEAGGGGVSNVYPLPPWQEPLKRWGNRRLLPDISWVADPFTGVLVVITADAQGDEGILVAGGTSVATPMFSGLWSVAAQKARRPLGQAAPLLYSLLPGAFLDVVALPDSRTNVTGTLTDSNGTEEFTADELALPLDGQRTFRSALFNGGTSEWYVITLGTDTTLQAAPGWDPATGFGAPNGVEFVNAVAR